MTEQIALKAQSSLPTPGALLELLKPITWFPPMWAFACGAVSSPVSFMDRWDVILLGILLAGPLVCGTSQVVNDWFDRHVDAINVALLGNDGAQKILHMQDAGNLVIVSIVEGDARMRAVQRLADDLTGG